MEFIAKQSALLRELSLVQGVVERKNTVPILANVLLSAAGETVRVQATDLDVSVRSEVTAAVATEGALSVSARKLHEIVRSLPPDSDVRFKADGEDWATITCLRSRFRIMGLPEGDFPVLPSSGTEAKVTFGVKRFRQMVQKVIFAVASDDARFALNGALLILAGKSICLVASDSHRLAYVKGRLPGGGPEGEVRVVIPQKALGEISRIAEEIGGEIVFSRQDNQIFFEMGRCVLSSRLLEGQFPSFEKVLPADNDNIVVLERAAFGDAVRRVSLISSERNRAVKLALSKGQLEISSRNPELGEANEVLPVQYTGQDVEIAFNAKYLVDFVGATSTAEIALELKDEASQGLLRPIVARESETKREGKSAGGKRSEGSSLESEFDYKYVVMPMRI